MGGQPYGYGCADQALHRASFAQTAEPESVSEGFEKVPELLKLMESMLAQLRTVWRILRGRRDARASAEASSTSKAPSTGCRSRNRSEQPSGQPQRSTATFLCPHCGLSLCVSEGNGALEYDVRQWERRCLYQALESPALCQLRPGGSGKVH
jgi:hypothetical protein